MSRSVVNFPKAKRVVVKRQVPRKLISIAAAAKMLGTSPEAIYVLVDDLELMQSLTIKSRKIPESEIDRFISENLGKDYSKQIDAAIKERKAKRRG